MSARGADGIRGRGETGAYPVAPLWLRTQMLDRPLCPAAVVSLDSGEAAVIQMAIEQDILPGYAWMS